MTARPTRRGFVAGAFGAAGLMSVGGCGFKPLYGTSGSGESASLDMASVRVEPIPDRIGQVLRNELTDRLTAGVGPQTARYALDVVLSESSGALQIQSTDTITRYNLQLVAIFSLVELATGNLVYKSQARGVGSYDVVTSEYSTLVAEQATARAAARELSKTIASLLALYFSRDQA
jgi:LPS-assembly lipoprotein